MTTKISLVPSRDVELELLRDLTQTCGEGAILAAVDEVGRGALAGPVSVGVALIDRGTSDRFPDGLRDSKQLSPYKREILDPLCRAWPLALAVGHAPPSVVDSEGIIGALRRAAANALVQLSAAGLVPDGVLLDGSHNWWSSTTLFDAESVLPDLPVRMQVKGDAQCAAVAAASVAAKVERDALMVELAATYPGYDWAHNKGYSSAKHIEGLNLLGPSPLHRISWNLPGAKGASDHE